MKLTQNLRISLSDFPLGSKSAPPLPPPMLTRSLSSVDPFGDFSYCCSFEKEREIIQKNKIKGNSHPVSAFLKICSNPKNLRIDRLTLGWNLRPPLYGPRAELNWTRYPRLTCSCFQDVHLSIMLPWWRCPRAMMIRMGTSHTSPLSSSQRTRNWTTRSGMEATLSALRYSGCFWKRVEFSRVDASSVYMLVFFWYRYKRLCTNTRTGDAYLCMLAQTQAQMVGSTWCIFLSIYSLVKVCMGLEERRKSINSW